MKRPMLYWVVLFVLGEVLFERIPLALIIAAAAAYAAVVCKIDNNLKRLRLIGMIFFMLGVVLSAYYEQKCKICDVSDGDNASFTGIVIDKQEKYDNRYRIKIKSLNDRRIAAYMIIETEEVLYPGIRLSGSGRVKDYMCATNPGQFDLKSYERSVGNMLFVEAAKIYSVKRPIVEIRNALDRVKSMLCEQYDQRLPDDNASLAKAMVLGDKNGLYQDIRALYQRNGIAHLIAISGLHIAMLGGTFYSIIRRLSGSYTLAAIIGITFIVFYGILTGLSGATVRAVIMLIMSIMAEVFGRRYDAPTAIAVALLIMVTVNPGRISQAGFLLSFGAVIGIACVFPVLKGEDKGSNTGRPGIMAIIISKLKDGIILSISVQLVIVPVLLYYFYEVPVYSVLLNIIVVPLMSVLLGALILLGVFGLAESAVHDYVNKLIVEMMTKISGLIFDIYAMLCKLTEKLPFHNLCVGRPDKFRIVIYYVLLVVTLFMVKSHRKRYIAVTCLMWVLLFISFRLPGKLIINMFDVGQGDGIYIRTPDHKSILIDGGSSSKKNVGTYILKNGIKYYGTEKIDYMIVTHSDYDHYSGALELLESNDIRVVNFILPAITNPDEAYKRLEEAADSKGCRIYYMKTGDKLNIGKVAFYCLNPDKEVYIDKNRGSIVTWMRYGSFDMLFTGDMDSTVEDKLLDNDMLIKSIRGGNKIEVLKVAHHGSATASSEGFLRSIGSVVSLISVGESNRYGHPAPEVMERLYRYSDHIYQTKDCGAVIIKSDGKKYSVEQYCK